MDVMIAVFKVCYCGALRLLQDGLLEQWFVVCLLVNGVR